MTALPPPLEQLDLQYNQLLDNVDAGHTSQADALAVLSGLSVADASGAVWAINADGDFVKAPFPGAPATPSDPAQFAISAPTTSSFPAGPAGGFTSQLPGPPAPAGLPQQFAPAGTPAQDPFGTSPAGGYSQAAPAGFGPLPAEQSLDAKPARRKREPKAAKNEGSVHGAGPHLLAPVLGFVSANRTLLAIAAVGAVLLFMLTHTGSSSAPSTAIPSSTASVPAPMPTAAPPAVPALPTVANGDAAVNELQSGKADIVAGVAVTQLDPATLGRVMALWSGAKTLGYKTTVGPAAAAADGSAVQQWTVTRADGTAVSSVKITWAKVGDTWKLSTPALF